MPLFAFACKSCGREEEVLVRGAEQPVCQACGSKKLEKLASHFAPAKASSEPVGCGAAQCCRMQGGGCMN